MSDSPKKVTCDRCGEKVFPRAIKIENLYKYNTSSKPAYIRSLMELEGVSREIATSWAEHGLFEFCEEKTRNCPECGKRLKTWQAKSATTRRAGGMMKAPRGGYVTAPSVSSAPDGALHFLDS